MHRSLLLGLAFLAGCSTPPPPTQTPVAVPPPTPAVHEARKSNVDPKDFPVAFYPGARLIGGGKMETTDHPAGVYTADLETPDAPEAVVTFYKKALPKAVQALVRDGARVGVSLSTPQVQVTIVHSKKEKTLINLVSNH